MDWISVKDSLPPDYKEVLYCAINDTIVKDILIGHRENGVWFNCYLFYASSPLNDRVEVTHWMPLPDYPKFYKKHMYEY